MTRTARGRLTGCSALCALSHAAARSGIAEYNKRLGCFIVHAHAGGTACRKHRAARNRNFTVGVKGLVVGSVCRPYSRAAAGYRKRSVGVDAVAGGGLHVQRAAVYAERKAVVAKVGIRRVKTVVLGIYRYISRVYVKLCRLKPLAAAVYFYCGPRGALLAYIHYIVAVQGVVACVNCNAAAVDIQKSLGIYRVVDACIYRKRKFLDIKAGFSVFLCGGAGFYTVFAQSVYGEFTRAANGHL